MGFSFIPASVQNIWNAWNIRGFMILSLCMQLILTLVTPFRNKISNCFVIFFIWSAYFLADWATLYAFGLISNAECQNSKNNAPVAPDVLAFWACFLLVHLGGPDSITAFSLEDNALWLRHLVGLVAQLFAFLYIFLKTLPNNRLLVPTILIFMAGMIKYGERTRALYLASLDNLKKSIKKAQPQAIIPVDHKFFNIFKGLVVDIMPDRSECEMSRLRTLPETPNGEFLFIVSELNLLYEVLYTKVLAANSKCGAFTRIMAYYCALAAFILFSLANKDEFRGVDVAITYALLVGVFVLDIANLMMFYTSFSPGFDSLTCFVMLVIAQGVFPFLISLALYYTTMFLARISAIDHFMKRKWSERMGSFNLLSHCLEPSALRKCQKPGFIWNKLAKMRCTSREDSELNRLWMFVFDDLKRKAGEFNAERMKKVYESRGDWAIEESDCPALMHYISEFQYDHTLLIWHVATEICYNIDGGIDDNNEKKRLSKILSDYMMYLLVKQPKLMSTVAGIGHVRYEDTCDEAKHLGREFGPPTMLAFCEKIHKKHTNITEPVDEVNHHTRSVLKYSCNLVQKIGESNNRWEIIFNVWMELLSYAAGHCRGDSHARLLSEGGEFITIVWMLMAHLGIGAQFPVE